MLKLGTIKQAIDAIAARDPEIGYSLAELFGTGRIGIETDTGATDDAAGFYFLFDRERVRIDKSTWFNEGLAALEQPLIIKYGEMAERQAMASGNGTRGYTEAARRVRRAGLAALVRHEVGLAFDSLRAQGPPAAGGPGGQALELLDRLRRQPPTDGLPRHAGDPRVLFAGTLDDGTPALFAPFTYSPDSLMQVAERQLPYFSVRFVLRCLVTGTARQLFVCLEDGAVAGMVFLRSRPVFFSSSLEIKYIASSAGGTENPSDGRPRRRRGVGTFLVAGVWMLWKHGRPGAREIVLDSELRATGFYEGLGFAQRRPYVYGLSHPAGRLLNALAVMVDHSPRVPPVAIEAMVRSIRKHVRLLASSRPGSPRHDEAVSFLRTCLLSRTRPDLARAAAEALMAKKARIGAAEALLNQAVRQGRIRFVDPGQTPANPLLIFKDDLLTTHLQGIFHLENAKRIKAIEEVLEHSEIAGKWLPVPPRAAEPEELAWVHTPDHIRRIAATAGKGLRSFDLDTQTTRESFACACLAAGGLFSLMDAIQRGPCPRGFAAVRPPGHHAEPGRAMGFCLFNNAALGARYMMHAHGARRVMIIDIDAHHGNGTQAAFYGTDEVLYLSMHQFPGYPGTGNINEIGTGRGEGFSVNVPLEKGMGDSEFVRVIHHLAEPLACAFEPDAILVSCGFDLYRHDPLGGLAGTPAGYAMLTRLLCRIADGVCGGRIVFVMEGGYSIQGIRECSARVLRELSNLPAVESERLDRLLSQPPFPALRKTMAVHARNWPILKHIRE